METARHLDVEGLLERVRPRRPIDGCSAVLLPYTADGAIDRDAFRGLLARTMGAGLTPAVNMDTGYGPHLSAAERSDVLRMTREALGPATRFIAGAGAFGADDPVRGYRAAVDEICALGATPIIFQSPWLSAQRDADLADAYRTIIGDAPAVIGFELGTMFASFGRIYSLDEYRRLLGLEAMVGAKHSSLDRFQELDRLALRDAERPEFTVFTGNDLAIDMIMYGSDYLLGLSTFDPVAFGQRDRWWAEGDARWLPLNDALQALGMLAFRPPVPAYKASAAAYLAMNGHIGSDRVHAECPRRGVGEAELLRPFAEMVTRAMG